MAKPFTFSTKRAGGNIYVQFALPDGGRTFQKSTGTSNRKEAEKIAMEWLANGNIPINGCRNRKNHFHVLL